MDWKKKNIFDIGSLKTQCLQNVRKSNKEKGITLIRPGIVKIFGISRLLAFFSYFFIIGKIIRQYNIERIVLYSVPTNGLQTLYWAKKHKIPVHFRSLDVSHQLVPSKILSLPTYVMERLVYKKVSSITAITPKLTKYVVEMGGNPNTTSYLPTGSDIDLFHPQPKDLELVRKFSIAENDRVVLFAGTLYNFSGLDVLIRFLINNPLERKKIKFIIVGHGEQMNLLRKMIEKNDLSDVVILTGFINYSELPKYINLADVCINPFATNKITDIIFPSKLYQYMACEKPVIATRLPGLIDIFTDNGGENNVYYFDLNKPEEFFHLLKRIDKNRKKDVNPSLKEIASMLLRRIEGVKN
ncbi:MAG: glycosyltransferase [Deltaproteobacteria bacterium]|nr:glycosyltransferase [Deltaproteobacteria bacterium]